jgi:cytochrome c biogenesis protein CcmG, thiol:disulfide interchange protein DsbE
MHDSAATYTDPPTSDNGTSVDPSSAETTYRPSVFRTKIVPAIALIMVVGLLVLLAYSLFAPERARVGQGGRINATGALVLENGRIAPDFSGTTFDGQPFQLSDHRGKIVVVNFWASWCPPCRDEMPLLVNASELLEDNVVLVGVDIWDREEDAREFLATYRVRYPNILDENGRIGIDYGVSGVPETFVISPDGRIVVRLPGPVSSMEQLREMIAEARN